jgi:outer membrane receptor protein involved in Fe transport
MGRSGSTIGQTVTLNANNLFDKFYLNASNKLGRGREVSTTYTVSF